MKTSEQFRVLTCLTLLSAAVVFASNTQANDWPQWRGPQRDGLSKEKALLAEWPKDGPKLAWQRTDIGSGYSTPAVIGDRIYVLSNEGTEDEFVQALYAHTYREYVLQVNPV